jgi:hypothetical protein
MLLRGLPLIFELGLLIFCVIDCIQTPEGAQRNLPKVGWLLLIVFLPLVGSIAWLVAGRPSGEPVVPYVTGFPEYRERHARRALAPDDDPDFLAQLGNVNEEHERTLNSWERDLARREEELRRRGEGREPGQEPGAR